jgi:hydrogenase-4 component F
VTASGTSLAILVLLPAASGLVAFLVRGDRTRRALLVATAIVHLAAALLSWRAASAAGAAGATDVFGGWFGLDATGRLVLTLASALFAAASLYGVGYLAREQQHGARHDWEEGLLFTNAPEAVFTGCLLLFLATMSLVCACRHLGVLWVAIEATTLASAPLLCFHRHGRSLEATWKYLLLCSVGIGIALLGNFAIQIAQTAGGGGGTLLVDELVHRRAPFDRTWLRVGFLCLLVGYGTKMGLAPMHAWLPDAHSEAPSLVSALLSGALLNCAFLGILRSLQVVNAAGDAAFAQPLLVGFGLASVGFAVVFVLGQASFKRMLAWSSVEHMGLLALAVGVGGTGASAAMLHAVNHSLTKGMLFLLAGNVLGHYRSRASADVRGLLRTLPVTGFLWVLGFLAITGSPPFAPFVSELAIVRAAFVEGHAVVGVAVLALLALLFLGMARVVLAMAHGAPPAGTVVPAREPWLAVVPPALLAAAIVALGVHVPAFVTAAIHAAAQPVALP